MISFNIFMVLSILTFTPAVFNVLRYVIAKFKGGIINDPFYMFITEGLKNKFAIVFASLAIIVFSLGHILPYTLQQSDIMLISSYERNIETYQEYSSEYAEAARLQIEQFQAMQSQMARTATIAQLQFFAEQQDNVGNSLTNEIRRFQKLIMEQKIEINLAISRVELRPRNKWFFGIN